jgi:hypothetical protein
MNLIVSSTEEASFGAVRLLPHVSNENIKGKMNADGGRVRRVASGFMVFAGKIKGINTAGQAPRPPPAAATAASRRVLNPSFPHSLNHARASTVAISLRSSINGRGFCVEVFGGKRLPFGERFSRGNAGS